MACAASLCTTTPRDVANSATSANGCRTPISLFTAMTLTSTVSGVMARASASTSILPSGPTDSTVTAQPAASTRRHGSNTERCSVATVTT